MDLPCTSFRLKQLNPFLKWNRHKQRICSLTHLTAGTAWGDLTTAISLAASAWVRILICRMCAPKKESHSAVTRMRNRTVFISQGLPGKRPEDLWARKFHAVVYFYRGFFSNKITPRIYITSQVNSSSYLKQACKIWILTSDPGYILLRYSNFHLLLYEKIGLPLLYSHVPQII